MVRAEDVADLANMVVIYSEIVPVKVKLKHHQQKTIRDKWVYFVTLTLCLLLDILELRRITPLFKLQALSKPRELHSSIAIGGY